jgi:D-alanyl-D-alanine carboxypeptidase (penicillin-binding protein 5/6)
MRPEQPLKQQKGWVYIARLIIIGLLVLGLVGSLMLGIIGTAYGVPTATAPTTAARFSPFSPDTTPASPSINTTGDASAVPKALFSRYADALPNDRIDGRPASEYQEVTSDLPTVLSPYAGLSTREGVILFERDIDTRVPMASTTKMMTAIVALEATALDTLMKVTWGAAHTEGTSAGLRDGMELTLHDALYALLLPSGNDAAVVIAQNLSGMESRFVELMNSKAAELGMTSTLFADSSGLADENHYTTVRDFLLLARYCMENPTFRQIVSTQVYYASIGGEELEFATTSALADVLEGATAIGIKTGSTEAAGYCYVGAAVLGGIELYTVVFAAPDTMQRFLDTATLLEWGFRHYRTIELINNAQQVAEVALLSWLDKTVPAFAPAAVRVDIFDLNGPITQEITIHDIEGEASKGVECGQIVWLQGSDVLTTSPVVVGQVVYPPDFFEGIAIAWQRFWGGFLGDPAHAQTKVLLKDELAIPSGSTA